MRDQENDSPAEDDLSKARRGYFRSVPGKIWLGLSAFYLIGSGVRNAPRGLPTSFEGWFSGLVDIGFALLTTYLLVTLCVSMPLAIYRRIRVHKGRPVETDSGQIPFAAMMSERIGQRNVRLVAVAVLIAVVASPVFLPVSHWVQ